MKAQIQKEKQLNFEAKLRQAQESRAGQPGPTQVNIGVPHLHTLEDGKKKDLECVKALN